MDARSASAVRAVAALCVAGIVLAGCVTVKSTPSADSSNQRPKQRTSSEFKVGDTVAARWTDGNMYLATVLSADGNVVTVKYVDDQSVRNVGQQEVRSIRRRRWAEGDKVLAVWALGRFYPGTVVKAGATRCTVKWDDGSPPTQVTVGKIIAAE